MSRFWVICLCALICVATTTASAQASKATADITDAVLPAPGDEVQLPAPPPRQLATLELEHIVGARRYALGQAQGFRTAGNWVTYIGLGAAGTMLVVGAAWKGLDSAIWLGAGSVMLGAQAIASFLAVASVDSVQQHLALSDPLVEAYSIRRTHRLVEGVSSSAAAVGFGVAGGLNAGRDGNTTQAGEAEIAAVAVGAVGWAVSLVSAIITRAGGDGVKRAYRNPMGGSVKVSAGVGSVHLQGRF